MNGLRMHHFISVFQKIKNRGGPTPPPPLPCERKAKTSPVSRISEIGTLTAKITHNFGDKNQQAIGKNGLRMHHLHPFFKNFLGKTPLLREDKKLPFWLYMIL